MAVTVRTDRFKNGTQILDTHPSASNIQVHDGHLSVLGWDGAWQTVALYAPGKWFDAVTTDAKAE